MTRPRGCLSNAPCPSIVKRLLCLSAVSVHLLKSPNSDPPPFPSTINCSRCFFLGHTRLSKYTHLPALLSDNNDRVLQARTRYTARWTRFSCRRYNAGIDGGARGVTTNLSTILYCTPPYVDGSHIACFQERSALFLWRFDIVVAIVHGLSTLLCYCMYLFCRLPRATGVTTINTTNTTILLLGRRGIVIHIPAPGSS